MEMTDGIVKEFFQRHELVKGSVPLGGVIHTVFPFLICDGIDFFQKGKISAIINFPDLLTGKDLSLPPAAQHVEPIEEPRKGVEQTGKPFR